MVFTLPSTKASERVQVWRKLQKFGCVAFRNAGYLLPNTPENRERLTWLSERVRSSKGEASVVEIVSGYVDSQPTFAFAEKADSHPEAIPFDMFTNC